MHDRPRPKGRRQGERDGGSKRQVDGEKIAINAHSGMSKDNIAQSARAIQESNTGKRSILANTGLRRRRERRLSTVTTSDESTSQTYALDEQSEQIGLGRNPRCVATQGPRSNGADQALPVHRGTSVRRTGGGGGEREGGEGAVLGRCAPAGR